MILLTSETDPVTLKMTFHMQCSACGMWAETSVDRHTIAMLPILPNPQDVEDELRRRLLLCLEEHGCIHTDTAPQLRIPA